MVGAGMKTAYMWYNAGARTLEDVLAGKGGVKLTAQQEIGIRYYDGKSAYLPQAIRAQPDLVCLVHSSPHFD
jgi:DNA polymerase lambda